MQQQLDSILPTRANPFRRRLLTKQVKLATLRTLQQHRNRNDMPGTYVTGGSGVPVSRLRKIERQTERFIDTAVQIVNLQREVEWLQLSADLFDAGKIHANGTAVRGVSKQRNKERRHTKDRLFCGVFPAGLSFCDRWVEEHGDYKKLAFLSYEHCRFVQVYHETPLLQRIFAHVADLKPGQQFQVSTTAQYVILKT
jgi:hypothetical protein